MSFQSLKEKGKEVVGEFLASNLSVPPHEISPHVSLSSSFSPDI